ncbi:hypothetical protein [Bradyrhizobium sp. OK095]|uniref:COG3904 family protein n=1 Tax=Bradyrhizobium sp. OK095 TaxID=1882760 RepID=UPI0008D6D45D|nr:hypothetical protein [Bradyrhizobium sp. OK095]SEN45118.1 hypothetical protein SAMN05443254_108268 [Bradyrhizobium sp. OK095]
MILRDTIAATLILTAASGTAAFSGSQQSRSTSTADGPPMVFYVAKGAPDACGRGCDTWIAVEGKIDVEAASRFRKFLSQTERDWPATLPLYFSSPGGSLEQGLAMGRMLRQRPHVARVARTTVKECGDAQSQSNDACIKIKQSGRALDADLSTRASLCSSACAYLILGATNRQIEPASVIGVHSPKFIPRDPQPSERTLTEAEQRSTVRADRLVAAYLATMGIDRGLLDLARTVSSESMHLLTRSELYRFGIDTRSFAETGWTSQGGPPGFIRKIAVARKDDDASFQTIELQLFCENKSRALLRLLWTSDAAAVGSSSLSLIAGSEQPVKLVYFPATGASPESWKALVAYDALKKLFAVPNLELRKSTTLPDGKTSQTAIAIDTLGLEAAWQVLSASGCPAPVGAGMLTPAKERR